MGFNEFPKCLYKRGIIGDRVRVKNAEEEREANADGYYEFGSAPAEEKKGKRRAEK